MCASNNGASLNKITGNHRLGRLAVQRVFPNCIHTMSETVKDREGCQAQWQGIVNPCSWWRIADKDSTG